MHPAFSILFFTTLAGAAQGLVVMLALAVLAGLGLPPRFLTMALLIAEALLIAGLAASFLHLGRKSRAWRAVLMWRTSWMSREVIVLPAYIGLVGLWLVGSRFGLGAPWAVALPLLAIAGALVLWVCTAMIYACLRFIEEWAHPLTLVNFTLLGLASGATLTSALAASDGATAFVRVVGPCALALTLIAWAGRTVALKRNATLRHRSTLQSATGIHATRLVQTSMGMSAGSFNTREFFHGCSAAAVRHVRLGAVLLCFVAPALCAAAALGGGGAIAWWLAVLMQAPGLLADRWLFFAQAKHPQNLYYQVVS